MTRTVQLPTASVADMFGASINLAKRRFIRHTFDARYPRSQQNQPRASGVDPDLRRGGGKFELFRASLVQKPRSAA